MSHNHHKKRRKIGYFHHFLLLLGPSLTLMLQNQNTERNQIKCILFDLYDTDIYSTLIWATLTRILFLIEVSEDFFRGGDVLVEACECTTGAVTLWGFEILHCISLLGFFTWERKLRCNRNHTTSGSVHTHKDRQVLSALCLAGGYVILSSFFYCHISVSVCWCVTLCVRMIACLYVCVYVPCCQVAEGALSFTPL